MLAREWGVVGLLGACGHGGLYACGKSVSSCVGVFSLGNGGGVVFRGVGINLAGTGVVDGYAAIVAKAEHSDGSMQASVESGTRRMKKGYLVSS